MTQEQINVSLFDEVKKLQIENRDLRGDCEHFTSRIKEMVAREMELERENARLREQCLSLVDRCKLGPDDEQCLGAFEVLEQIEAILSNVKDEGQPERGGSHVA